MLEETQITINLSTEISMATCNTLWHREIPTIISVVISRQFRIKMTNFCWPSKVWSNLILRIPTGVCSCQILQITRRVQPSGVAVPASNNIWTQLRSLKAAKVAVWWDSTRWERGVANLSAMVALGETSTRGLNLRAALKDRNMMPTNSLAIYPMTSLARGTEGLPTRLNADSNAGVARPMALKVAWTNTRN